MKKYVAEIIGSFAWVFTVSILFIMKTNPANGITFTSIGLALGLIIVAMTIGLGFYSGGYYNPILTLAFWIKRTIHTRQVPLYLVAQLAGAVLAIALLRFLFPNQISQAITLPTVSPARAFVIEAIISFLYCLVALRSRDDSKKNLLKPAIALGSLVVVATIIAGPLTGASLNPFRSFVPALFELKMDYIWIYLLAPLLGAPFGAFVTQGLEREKKSKKNKTNL